MLKRRAGSEISKFDISETGALTFTDEYKVDAATKSGPGAYNFLGLTGFDIQQSDPV